MAMQSGWLGRDGGGEQRRVGLVGRGQPRVSMRAGKGKAPSGGVRSEVMQI